MKIILAAAVAVVGLAGLGTSSASAAVVCNHHGDCWRTEGRPRYPSHLRLRVYPDNWRWGRHEERRYRWRDAGHGHGYYRDGAWINIR
jgi:hypothetical protein